jgi:hypothetical protein
MKLKWNHQKSFISIKLISSIFIKYNVILSKKCFHNNLLNMKKIQIKLSLIQPLAAMNPFFVRHTTVNTYGSQGLDMTPGFKE